MKERYTRNEDVVCASVHIFTLLITFFIMLLMVNIIDVQGNAAGKITLYTYCGGLIAYLLTSVIYHLYKKENNKKTLMKINIFSFFVCLLTLFTPLYFVTLAGTRGIVYFVVSAVCFCISVVLYFKDKNKFRLPVALCTFVCLFICYISSVKIINDTTWVCLVMYALNSVLTLTGLILYYKNYHFYHVFWHIFFMVGTTMQSLATLVYVLPVNL